MNNLLKHWQELRPLYRVLLFLFALLGAAALFEAIETIAMLIENMH